MISYFTDFWKNNIQKSQNLKHRMFFSQFQCLSTNRVPGMQGETMQLKLAKLSSGQTFLKNLGFFYTHLCFKTFQCLLNMIPYSSNRFIPSRLQHFMLIWEFWRNGATVGLGIRPLEVLWPGISPKSSCRCTKFQHFSIYIFFFSNFFFCLESLYAK